MNCLWLLKTVKEITARVDNKKNKQFMLHESLMYFFEMRQVETESKNSFLNCFKSNVQNLELVKGINFLYRIEHVELSDGGVSLMPTGRKQERSYLPYFFLKRSDLKIYRRLLEQLQESAYIGREEYPHTTVDVYDTFTRFSGQFSSVGERY